MNPRTYLNIFLSAVLVLSGALPCYADGLQYESLWNSKETDTNHVQDQEPVQEPTEDFAAAREARILNAEAEFEANNPVQRPNDEVYRESQTEEEPKKDSAYIGYSSSSDSGGYSLSAVSETEYSLDLVSNEVNADNEIMPLASLEETLLQSILDRLITIQGRLSFNNSPLGSHTYTINGTSVTAASNSIMFPVAFMAYKISDLYYETGNIKLNTDDLKKYTYGIWDDLYTNFPVNGETDPPNRKLVNLVAMLVNRAYIMVDYLKDVRSNTSAISAYTSDIRSYLWGNIQLFGDTEPKSYSVVRILALCFNRLARIDNDLDEVISNTSAIGSYLHANLQLYGDTESKDYSVVRILALCFNRLARIDTDLDDVVNNTALSANRLTSVINNTGDTKKYLHGVIQLIGDIEPKDYSAVQILGLSFNRLARIDTDLDEVVTNTTSANNKLTNTNNFLDDIRNYLHGKVRLIGDTEDKEYSAFQILALSFNRLARIDSTLEDNLSGSYKLTGNNAAVKYSLADLQMLTFNRLESIIACIQNIGSELRGNFQLQGDNASKIYSAAQLLKKLVDLDYGNQAQNNRIIELLEGLQNFEVKVDLAGTNDILERIERLLIAAGVIENTKDVLDVLIGEFDIAGSIDTAVTELSASVEKAFPFNMVFIVIEVLNLLVVDAELPVLEFEIAGSPLLLDMNNELTYGLGEVTSWVSLITLVVLLFANTKKFIIGWGDNQ